jgi:hypothetical protein
MSHSLGTTMLVAMAALGSLTQAPHAQQGEMVIEGRVTDSAGTPIALAGVWITGAHIGASSDSLGRYRIVVPFESLHGQHTTAVARLIGYHADSVAITLGAGTLIHDFALAAKRLPSPPERRSEPGSVCLADDEHSDYTLDDLRTYVTETDTTSPWWLNRLIGKLPLMDSVRAAREIRHITHGPLCAAAERAYSAIYPLPDSVRRAHPRRVDLFRVGDLYLVSDPNVMFGEWCPLLTFDAQWVLLANVGH